MTGLTPVIILANPPRHGQFARIAYAFAPVTNLSALLFVTVCDTLGGLLDANEHDHDHATTEGAYRKDGQ